MTETGTLGAGDGADVATLRAERDLLAAKLAESEARFALLYDQARLPLAIISVTEARYIYTNRAHCELFGYSAEYYRTVDPYQVWVNHTAPEDFERERVMFQQLADGQIDCYSIEKTFRLADGRRPRCEVTMIAQRDGQGRLHHLSVLSRDISAQTGAEEQVRDLQEQLRRAQKIEVAGRLAGGVAHDFNNRLLIVLGYAELLRAGLKDERQLGFVQNIVDSAKRSAELTRQLLAFSRRQVLAPRSLDAGATVEGMRRVLDSLLGEKVEVVVEARAGQRVYCDPGQLEQVLLNLAINARDAMPAGGRLTLATRDVAAGAAELPRELADNDFVAVDVRDTGTGIPVDVLPHVFEPFFTTKPVGQGTGLGLSTVEGIVRQSGGHVSVATSEGGGSTFTVYLPVSDTSVREAVQVAPSIEVEKRRSRHGTILICDDDNDVRTLLADVMAVGSYHVLTARNAAECRTHLASGERVDLLITDIVMPNQSGPELAAELRRSFAGLLVLFVSGYADSESLAAIEGEEFLAKPFSPAVVLRRVREMLDARARASLSVGSSA